MRLYFFILKFINVLDIFDICSNLPNKSEGYILVGKVFNKVVLLIVAVTIGIMFIRLLTVIIPQKQTSIDPSAGISYLNERETAIYTEASPTPEPTQAAAPTETGFYEIKDNNYKAAFKDIYICGDSLMRAISEYDILDYNHVTADVGVNSSHIDANLPYIVALKPKVLVLHYGSNTIGSKDAADKFIDDYKASILKLKEQLPDTVIFVDGIFPVKSGVAAKQKKFQNISYYNERLAGMCSDLGIHFLDYTILFNDFEENYYDADGIHPLKKFYTDQYLPYVYTEVMKNT